MSWGSKVPAPEPATKVRLATTLAKPTTRLGEGVRMDVRVTNTTHAGILYFRALGPSAVKDIPLELMATVPGTFTAPASRAYLYDTNEHKHWVAPATITVTP